MNKFLKYSLILVVVFSIVFAVYFFFIKSDNQSEINNQKEVYTCSMHPEIIRDKPGNCPICGMTLVKKITENQDSQDNAVDDLLQPTDNFIVGNYETTTAKDTLISGEISLPGMVTYDPNSSVNISARISGRIEKMYVNYKYQKVNKGQKLFDLYSPELLTEQQNFIYLITNDAENNAIINAAKQKLILYGMTNNQINSLLVNKKVNPKISIFSPVTGIIQGTEKMENSGNKSMQNTNNTTEILTVKQGNYINKGDIVFQVTNTSSVWGIFNVSQGFNNQIKINQSIKITSELDADETLNARINFIETQLNSADKSNRIRVYINNNNSKFPIGLRLQGIVKTDIIKGIWLSKQSLVSIGNKKVVFKKVGNGFKATAIKAGFEVSDYVQIVNGILANDTIAKNAQYLIDSESFIKTE